MKLPAIDDRLRMHVDERQPCALSVPRLLKSPEPGSSLAGQEHGPCRPGFIKQAEPATLPPRRAGRQISAQHFSVCGSSCNPPGRQATGEHVAILELQHGKLERPRPVLTGVSHEIRRRVGGLLPGRPPRPAKEAVVAQHAVAPEIHLAESAVRWYSGVDCVCEKTISKISQRMITRTNLRRAA